MFLKLETNIHYIGQLILQKCLTLILKDLKVETNQVMFQEKTDCITTEVSHLQKDSVLWKLQTNEICEYSEVIILIPQGQWQIIELLKLNNIEMTQMTKMKQ